MNFVIYTRYIKENPIIPPFTLLFSLAISPLSRHSPLRHLSLVTHHFSPFPSPHSPFEGSQRLLGMYSTRDFHHIFFVIRLSSFVISLFFPLHPPSAYGLRPITYSLFFRLETPFLPFFTSLYYTMNQLFTHPFYTNRPRFV